MTNENVPFHSTFSRCRSRTALAWLSFAGEQSITPACIDSAGVGQPKSLKPTLLGKVAKSALGIAPAEAELTREFMSKGGLARTLIAPLERP